uniref:CNNM transmembrane domain-containing protein n=1 Tax=Romanomermis culicivorax TaxID=13658 RepID=A0A915HGK7_ROMCU
MFVLKNVSSKGSHFRIFQRTCHTLGNLVIHMNDLSSNYSHQLNVTSLNCMFKAPNSIFCDNQKFIPSTEDEWNYRDYRFWIFVGAYIGVMLFAGLMSGLTLAIFSLDLTSLRVLEVAGSERDKKYASRIMPLAQRQYLVLVSLVLANALAVEAMPLIMDRISSPAVAILISVTAVLIFGEVLPQALCGRYGLVIGYLFNWLVWIIIGVEFIVAFPISKVLELSLGKNYGTFYRRAELKALVDFHGPAKKCTKKTAEKSAIINDDSVVITEERLTIDEVLIIKALSVMIKLEDVFMVSIDAEIDVKMMHEILDLGHSRIPVYAGKRSNLIGLLLTKSLILVDPNKVTPVRELIQDNRYFYPIFWIEGNMPLYILLNKFQEGASSHMAFVREKLEDGSYQALGMVTLEDVLEEILQEEIYDETDAFRGIDRCCSHFRRTSSKVTFLKRLCNKNNNDIGNDNHTCSNGRCISCDVR